MNSSLVYENVGPICQLMARCTHLLGTKDLSQAWIAMEDMIHLCERICRNIDTAWSSSCLSSMQDEHDAGAHPYLNTTDYLRIMHH